MDMFYINPIDGKRYSKRRLYEKVLDGEVYESLNRGGLLLNEEVVIESLIATYDIFKVSEIFKRKYPDVVFRIVNQNNGSYINYIPILFVPSKKMNGNLKAELVDFMKFCGYIHQPSDKHIENGNIRMVFKPMFQSDDCTDEVRERCRYIYHITDKRNLKDIGERGLIPSAQNMYFNYPDRIYFVIGNNLNARTMKILDAVYQSHGKRNSVVIMFDMEKISDNVRFHTDFDANESIFTHDNIPPTAIAGVMDWSKVCGGENSV